MSLRLGDRAPDFHAQTTRGPIHFHDWLGNSYGILFSHPKDFTPVCTTELGYLAKLLPQFERRNVKVIGLSVDAVGEHERWLADIRDASGAEVTYPIIGDHDLSIAKAYDMLPSDAGETAQGRTVRSVFVTGPDKLIKAILVYPMSSGRNFDEVLRLIDSIQLTATHKVATPVNWRQGQDVIILASVSDAEARNQYPDGWKTVKPYLRVIAQPGTAGYGSD